MPDAGLVYAAIRERVGELARGLTDTQAAQRVPACPAWDVHDVLAHLAGVAVDVNAGRLDGVGTDPWTAQQVAARRGVAVETLLAEWDLAGPQFEAGLSAIGGGTAALAVADAWNHEQDVRGALGLPGGRDVEAEHLAVEGYATAKLGLVLAGRLAALRLTAGSHSWDIGDGTPAAVVQAEAFELARAVAARRTRAQLLAYEWEGEAEPYVELLAAGGPAEPLPT